MRKKCCYLSRKYTNFEHMIILYTPKLMLIRKINSSDIKHIVSTMPSILLQKTTGLDIGESI